MVKLEFFDPSGVTEYKQAHAPRLESLTGKRIGLLSNDQWQSYRMLPMIHDWLKQDFHDIEVLAADAFPQGTSFIGTEETAQLVERSGVDAVIIGNAA
jgi:hypothetical protein